jgi:arylsulfatase A-like enzyme
MDTRQHHKARTPNTAAGAGLACILGVVLLLICAARLMSDLGSTALNVQIVQTALADPLWRTQLGRNIALFSLSLLALHMLFGVMCWLLAILTEGALPKVRCSRYQWVLIWFLIGVVFVLTSNATYFPRSSLGEPYQAIVRARILGASPQILIAGFFGTSAASILLIALWQHVTWRKYVGVFGGAAALAVMPEMLNTHPAHAATAAKPNIVFIGVDSLRPDTVGPDVTPHLQTFLGNSVQMTDAITPLARTFPSWVSILTGKHPHTTGAFMNLLPREMIQTGMTLPDILREHGYKTWYAIDETRFSNIDVTYGFDHTITPAIGGSDFVLTRFADTPLSNLVMNTRIGALLFPHVYANRSADVTYDPDSFVRRIDRELETYRPAFLAVHLTLPHWPYTWATSSANLISKGNASTVYDQAVHRVDRQFGDLLAMLKGRGILDNAIVVVLSDHGEALGQSDDFMPEFFPDKDQKRTEFQKWGHGTSVFSPHQYRVVLGMRAYGDASHLIPRPSLQHDPVSLVDLAPTILDLIGLPMANDFDGQSLVPLFRPGKGAILDLTSRIRFTESEYNPQGFSFDKFTASALAAAAQVYRLDSTTDRITVRPDKIDSIMSTRQYAALLNDSMAAAVPADGDDRAYRLVYIPLHDSRGDTREQSLLRQALEERFGLRFNEDGAELKH